MRDETVRLIASWQASEDHGLDAMARKILGPGSEFSIDKYNSAEDEGLMKEDLNPKTTPSWCLWADSTAPTEPMGGYAVCRNILLCGGLVTLSTADAKKSGALANLTTRANLLSMHRFNSAAKSEAYRELNGIRIMKMLDVTEDVLVSAKGRRRVWGFSWIRLVVADTLTKVP